jgi:glycerol kinase
VSETTALGAAYLAGLAVGFWQDTAEVAEHWSLDRRFEPAVSEAERALTLNRWQRAVDRTRDWER